jgi:hypothetical protein
LAVKRVSTRGTRVSSAALLAACGVALGLLASGCGGSARDAHEPSGTYTVEVTKAKFPAKQAIAHDAVLELTVRNADSRTIPNVAVTLDSFYYTSTYPHLASNQKPVWIVNTGPGTIPSPLVNTEEITPPGGAETVFVNTWALGSLAPGASKRFTWHVTPIKAGVHTVHYTVAAGLDGKARARLADGAPVKGSFVASIAPVPARTHVNPQTGLVVAGGNPASAVPVGAAP